MEYFIGLGVLHIREGLENLGRGEEYLHPDEIRIHFVLQGRSFHPVLSTREKIGVLGREVGRRTKDGYRSTSAAAPDSR